jgi:hypothetical protein
MVLAPTRIPSLRSSPWILTQPHRGFSLPRRVIRSTVSGPRGGRPGPSPTVGPLPPHELTMPAKQGLRRDPERGPTIAGQRPARRGEERPIVAFELWAADRAAKNSYLVAKDGVLELELRHTPTSSE